jgi:segregation and condensation protein B
MSTTTEHTNVVELRPREMDERVGTEAEAPYSAEGGDVVDAVFGAPLEHQLEALLFVSPTPLTTAQLAELTDEDEDDLQDCLLDLMQQWAEGSRGVVLERVAGGWAFRASDQCADQLRRLMRPQGDARLSASALETLAIVAYLQPVSRPDIAKIRGVSVDAAMTGLLERGLVEEAGRSDSGAVLFRTTAHFERAFGLASIGSLPEIESFGPGEEEIARMRDQLEKMAAARVD